ncbi:MAG: hypothetical protein AB7T31_16835 [Gemmatimonadales bacterium]
MATDRQLSRNFRLSEFPGWRDATEEDVERLEETVARVLQPIRTALGVPVRIGSWMRWSDGSPRSGAHAHGGTVDFTVDQGRTPDAFAWGSQHLIPSGYVGRWIYEPARSAAEGTPQGEHIHVAPRVAMVEKFADGRIQVLEEREEGEYFLHFETVPAIGAGLLALAAAAVALYLGLAPRRQQFAL